MASANYLLRTLDEKNMMQGTDHSQIYNDSRSCSFIDLPGIIIYSLVQILADKGVKSH